MRYRTSTVLFCCGDSVLCSVTTTILMMIMVVVMVEKGSPWISSLLKVLSTVRYRTCTVQYRIILRIYEFITSTTNVRCNTMVMCCQITL